MCAREIRKEIIIILPFVESVASKKSMTDLTFSSLSLMKTYFYFPACGSSLHVSL